MTFTVTRQYVRSTRETPAGWIIDMGHATKTFNTLKDAQYYARDGCRDIRNEKDETIYISTNEKTIEMWSVNNGRATSQTV